MNTAKFYLFKSDKNDEFYFHLKAGNGEIILRSEGYSAKHNCLNGIASVKNNSQEDDQYKRLTAKNGEYYFNLKAANGEVIGSSETYVSTQGRDGGIESVKRNSIIAEITDLTIDYHNNDGSEQHKEFEIIVNGRLKVVTAKKLSFLEVVKLAFSDVISNGRTIYTMTFKRGVGNRPEGSLVEGDEIRIKSGVIFNVSATDKS